MKNQDNSRKRYKKMSSQKDTTNDRKKTTPNRPGQTNIPKIQKQSNTSRDKTLKSPQIVIIVLLVFIILILTLVVYMFFQPDRVQLWQEQLIPSGQAASELPAVKRLLPTNEEETLNITELPAPSEEKIAPNTPVSPEEPEKETRNARLFYVKVNMEGQIALKSSIRAVEYNGSPLTETINNLLKGPSSDEINKGSLTLIPDGTRLLSARVEGNTAYLNFNEAFRFNSLGREGYTAQLKQIVYTATEFSNVNAVQIMIEGGVKEYLGGEGTFVGEPLTRETFQRTP